MTWRTGLRGGIPTTGTLPPQRETHEGSEPHGPGQAIRRETSASQIATGGTNPRLVGRSVTPSPRASRRPASLPAKRRQIWLAARLPSSGPAESGQFPAASFSGHASSPAGDVAVPQPGGKTEFPPQNSPLPGHSPRSASRNGNGPPRNMSGRAIQSFTLS